MRMLVLMFFYRKKYTFTPVQRYSVNQLIETIKTVSIRFLNIISRLCANRTVCIFINRGFPSVFRCSFLIGPESVQLETRLGSNYPDSFRSLQFKLYQLHIINGDLSDQKTDRRPNVNVFYKTCILGVLCMYYYTDTTSSI